MLKCNYRAAADNVIKSAVIKFPDAVLGKPFITCITKNIRCAFNCVIRRRGCLNKVKKLIDLTHI